MRRLRAVVVDDEPLARDAVRLLLARDPDVELVGEASGVDAVALIARARPDVLFLDVQMPEVDGFDVLAAAGLDAVPAVVFVTAYDEYAVRAFDVHAIDYLLKPFDDTRFALALERAKRKARADRPGESLAALMRERAPYRRRLLVRTRERFLVVPAEEIDWIGAADYYAALHVGPRTHLLRQPLAALERELDPERFARVHRSAIVNVERVREIQPLFRGDSLLVLADGTRVRLSRTYRDAFARRFATGRR